ncbi:hypothetical protein M2E96_27960, partial [Klebsiella pneumoniae]|nr:hypothetical protein [Klebsiella pneumoniae]MDZ3529107.1 hypothetical protein [Klebsiella pneumoniae]MDZ3717043.1 hypothetical protein [Klebsiella pneumoniae]MDZ3761965.1 hypothetical protein [Klebsiella pneumoniae]MDZ3816476.1 hypothetical protein [Klebsiella pneumoniae]
QNDVTLKMPAFEWVHVQLHQQKGMISLSPPTICNSAASNLAEIDRQNAALSKLNAKTWGVTYLEDSNGRFLVLPKGTAVDRTQSWTVGNGRSKQNALRLVKE